MESAHVKMVKKRYQNVFNMKCRQLHLFVKMRLDKLEVTFLIKQVKNDTGPTLKQHWVNLFCLLGSREICMDEKSKTIINFAKISQLTLHFYRCRHNNSPHFTPTVPHVGVTN